MSRSLPLLVTCAFALVLAGCDRESAEPAQPQENSATQNKAEGAEQLTGKVDRAFAGQQIPEFTVTDPAGKTLALRSTKGKPILVNLWATWCAPCVVEMPMLDELASELAGSVAVLTISEDMAGADKVGPFFAEKKFANLPQWMDPKNDLAFAYGGGAALPLTVLYDAEGKEVWRIMGGFDWSTAEARELVAEAS
ncbi:MAG: TlpA disulfide reductase family protein [Croceibacterium sp.]